MRGFDGDVRRHVHEEMVKKGVLFEFGATIAYC